MDITLDQTPKEFASRQKSNLANSGFNSVSAAGANDKDMVTAGFSITLAEEFLLSQITYGSKTSKRLPRDEFSE